MKLVNKNIYHVYNRGINRENLFPVRDNYLYFKRKLKKFLIPNCNLLCYCLMPNHFHLMIYTNDNFDASVLSSCIKTLLSSYTKAINKMFDRTGSLFQQNTKAKCLSDFKRANEAHYPIICFNYIHQNPMTAGFVKKMEDWEFSSFRGYVGLERDTLCSHQIARDLLHLPENIDEFYNLSYNSIDADKIKNLL